MKYYSDQLFNTIITDLLPIHQLDKYLMPNFLLNHLNKLYKPIAYKLLRQIPFLHI